MRSIQPEMLMSDYSDSEGDELRREFEEHQRHLEAGRGGEVTRHHNDDGVSRSYEDVSASYDGSDRSFDFKQQVRAVLYF